MEKILHLCFTSWCTEGVSALKVSQDSTHNFLTSRQTVWLLRHTGCRTRLAGDWSPDTTFTCWQDVHETDSDFDTDYLTSRQTAGQGSHWDEILRQTVWLWDRLSDSECKEGVKTTKVLQDSKTQLSHASRMCMGQTVSTWERYQSTALYLCCKALRILSLWSLSQSRTYQVRPINTELKGQPGKHFSQFDAISCK